MVKISSSSLLAIGTLFVNTKSQSTTLSTVMSALQAQHPNNFDQVIQQMGYEGNPADLTAEEFCNDFCNQKHSCTNFCYSAEGYDGGPYADLWACEAACETDCAAC